MERVRQWVPLPTLWIEERGLSAFQWGGAGEGSNNAAALLCLILIAHHADGHGRARLTYDQISDMSGLSRAKIAAGLKILHEGEFARSVDKSHFQLAHFDMTVRGWGQLPARRLYTKTGRLTFARGMHLRQRAELDALKIFLLFVARRDVASNRIDLSYDKIAEYSGISRNRITDALSFLTVNSLVVTHKQESDINDFATANSYRLRGLNPYNHAGTTGRAEVELESRRARQTFGL